VSPKREERALRALTDEGEGALHGDLPRSIEEMFGASRRGCSVQIRQAGS
jgi:hypothetical protein